MEHSSTSVRLDDIHSHEVPVGIISSVVQLRTMSSVLNPYLHLLRYLGPALFVYVFLKQ
jgi:hypothetical protein